jgi:hypothetical protein
MKLKKQSLKQFQLLFILFTVEAIYAGQPHTTELISQLG